MDGCTDNTREVVEKYNKDERVRIYVQDKFDYYTYVKGIEYLLCFYYFLIFPVFFMFVNHKKE